MVTQKHAVANTAEHAVADFGRIVVVILTIPVDSRMVSEHGEIVDTCCCLRNVESCCRVGKRSRVKINFKPLNIDDATLLPGIQSRIINVKWGVARVVVA